MDPLSAGGLITAVGSMATTTKAILDAVKAAKAKAKGSEIEQSLSDALEHIFSLQSNMIDIQAKILTLQEDNSRLRDQIRREEERSKERKQYQRKEIHGVVVMVLEAEPNIYYCPACLENKGQAIPIQVDRSPLQVLGSHVCPQCTARYSLHG